MKIKARNFFAFGVLVFVTGCVSSSTGYANRVDFTVTSTNAQEYYLVPKDIWINFKGSERTEEIQSFSLFGPFPSGTTQQHPVDNVYIFPKCEGGLQAASFVPERITKNGRAEVNCK